MDKDLKRAGKAAGKTFTVSIAMGMLMVLTSSNEQTMDTFVSIVAISFLVAMLAGVIIIAAVVYTTPHS